jgi:hypothetical protein
MTTSASPDRQTFREVLAGLAAKTLTKIPALNGRVEKACRLVLGGDVELHPDGTALVNSLTDPTRAYQVSPGLCLCKDFDHAPEHLCCHRLAVGFVRKVQELLPPAPEPATSAHYEQKSASALPEAPASVNMRLIIAGRDVQLTLRDHDEVRLLARLEEVLQRYPAPQTPPASQGASPRRPEVTGVQEVGWCHKHGVEMTLNQKDGRSWWSHRTADGWCKGK